MSQAPITLDPVNTDTGIHEKPKRGFALLDPARLREIASMGGSALKPEQRAFSRNAELASSAGRKGGKAKKSKVTK